MTDLKQLSYFREIARKESISKASEVLFISQPALARSLHQLEEEFGCNLFERVGRRIQLNDKGRVALDYANQIFDIIESMYRAMREKE